MDRHRNTRVAAICPSTLRGTRNWPRSALTLIEVLVIIGIIVALIAMLLPASLAMREQTRRMHCTDRLGKLGLAIMNHEHANKCFPPGTICASSPIEPHHQYDVWGEAGKTEPGFHGTGFLLRLLPFLEMFCGCKQWDRNLAVGPNAERGDRVAVMEFRDFYYCPSRRIGFREGTDNAMMLAPTWTGGGTDYGGCAGRHAAFTNETGYNLCDASMSYEPSFQPICDRLSGLKKPIEDTDAKRWGVFGRVNVSTTYRDIRDGASNTIITGELQRLEATPTRPGSKDGWAVGGPATLFTTGAMVGRDGTTFVDAPNIGRLMNNGFWGSPGSEHSGGANYGLGDGSVRFLSDSTDPSVFALLGSMADGGFSYSLDELLSR